MNILEKLNQSVSQFLENRRDKQLIKEIQKDPENIFKMNTPSGVVQLEAVKANPFVISSINNPSEKVQLAAVNQNPAAILHIENPSEEVQLAAVQQNGNYIQTISTPSERVQLAAVNQHGYFIEAIDNPSERVQMVAIEEDLGNITLINSPCEAAQIYAVKHDPFVVSLIPTTEAVRILAVEQKPSIILHIENPSETLCKLAIEKEYPGAVISFTNPETTKKLFARLENIDTQEERIQVLETLKNEYQVNTQARIEAIEVLQGNAPERIFEDRFKQIRDQFSYAELELNEAINDAESGIIYNKSHLLSDSHYAKRNIQESAQFFASEIKKTLSPEELLRFALDLDSPSNLPLGKMPTTEETLSLFSNQYVQKEFSSAVFENENIIGRYELQKPTIQYQHKSLELLQAGTHPYSPNYKEVFEKAGLKEEFNEFEKACCERSKWNGSYNYAIQAHDIAEIGDLERKLPALNERIENSRDLVYNKLSVISETNNRLQAGSDIIQEPKKLSSDFQNLGRGKSENDLAVQATRLWNQAGNNEQRQKPQKALTQGKENSISNKSSLNAAQDIHSLQAVSDNYKSLGYNSVAEAINKYTPNYTSIIDSGNSLNYKIENVEIQAAGAKKLYGDIAISNNTEKPAVTLENLHIKDKATGLKEPLQTNGINICEQPADTVKKLLSGGKQQVSSGILGLNKTAVGWGLSLAKQAFSAADTSAGI